MARSAAVGAEPLAAADDVVAVAADSSLVSLLAEKIADRPRGQHRRPEFIRGKWFPGLTHIKFNLNTPAKAG